MKLLSILIAQQWKQAVRSSIWQKNLAVNLIMGFFFFLLFLEAVVVAFVVGYNWHEIIETGDPLFEMHRVFAWYFAATMAMRFFFQKLPALEVRPYLHLPVSRQKLIAFLMAKGSVNLFALLSLIVLLPFAIFQVTYYHDSFMAFRWFLIMFALDITFNFVIIYLKKTLASGIKTVVAVLLLLLALAAGDFFGWYSWSELAATMLGLTLLPSAWPWLLLLLPVAAYILNARMLQNGFYLDELTSKSENESQVNTGDFAYFRKAGLAGSLMLLDIKLYLRNKRTKSILYLTPLFLGYGLFFYNNEDYTTDSGFMIFIGIFITSVMMINYLQYAFAYEGGFFDFLSSSGLEMKDYLQAKMQLASLVGLVSYVLTIPYVYYGYEILVIHTACLLFSIGVIAPAILYMATYNKKTMVLTKGSAFNYQGVGTMHFLVMLPVFIVPLMVFLPFKWMLGAEAGWLALAIAGLLALPFRKYFIQAAAGNLLKRKYIMAQGFREKN